MQRLIILFLMGCSSCSTSEQSLIIGKWKPVKVSYKSSNKSENIIYDVDKADSINKAMLQLYLSQENLDSQFLQVDTANFKAELDKEFTAYKLANLELKKDSTFLWEVLV